MITIVAFLLGPAAMAATPDGFRPSPSAYDGSTAVQLVHPGIGGKNALYVGGYIVDAELISTSPLTRRLSGAHLGAGWAVSDWLRVDLSLPVYTTLMREVEGWPGVLEADTVSGVGDLRLGLTVPLREATEREPGFGLAPWVDVPTGDPVTGTGGSSASGGASLIMGAGGGSTTGWRLNAGVGSGADGTTGRFGAGFDHPVMPRARLGVEIVADQGIGPDATRRVEVHGVADIAGNGSTRATLLVGTGVLPDSGSPALRMGLGLSWGSTGLSDDPDGDGIPSDQDACPWTPEDDNQRKDRDGCPEADGDHDNVPDAVDQCPDEKEDHDGYLDRDGCADLDNDFDGILDEDDECPLQPGPAATGGCPDEDMDGVPDREDECPTRRGPVESAGCPDWDGDRVPDYRDQCPTRAADPSIDPKRSDGCPSEAWRGVGAIHLDEPVFFEFNRAGVDPRSLSHLLQVARIMNTSPDIVMLEVAGHADEVGSSTYNRRLSRLRAAAVRDVLIRQGGVDPDRIVAIGYGEDRPAVSNATDNGRAENRRVEFLIRRTSAVSR
jgi:outer membrane protein OmpA-like peptidoglycan-associated protein